MDVLIVRNVLHDAEKAKDKKAPLGVDVTIENFTDEDKFAYELIDEMNDVSKKTKEALLGVGIDTDENGRAGSFLQVDQTNIFTNNSISNNVELMNIGLALDKYDWLKDYFWKVVNPGQDKYTAKTALREEDGIKTGFFVRSLPNTKEIFPVQACMFINDSEVMQTAHNIIIAEENSELHLITGCATGDDISSAMHIGVSEMYLKPGAKITYTMVHNWAEQVEVRPRTGIKLADNAT
ncbi:MAG: SufD family Fe-S cluster assembly protein, partial [archaeon]|nr:SufD family Fe-S cluster assembly protein [archaeon]